MKIPQTIVSTRLNSSFSLSITRKPAILRLRSRTMTAAQGVIGESNECRVIY